MNIKEYQQFDALGLAELVRNGETTPQELLHIAQSLAEDAQETVNATAHMDTTLGEQKISNNDQGIFYGVPFLIKELLSYPGLKTAMGSRLFAEYIPPHGSAYTDRIDASGLITFGNTTSSEFGLLGSTETLLHGTTRNPWHRDLSAAGSSGGSAAAVASGIVPMAHASDGGGSIRIPASVCGLFGLMPSAGRCVPAMENSGPFADLVMEHCVTKSVRDSAAFLSITEDKGMDSRKPKFSPLGFIKEPNTQPLRIAVYTETMMGTEADAEIIRVIQQTSQLCQELGHKVVSIDGPKFDGKAISLAFFTLAGFAMDQVTKMMEPMLQRSVNENDLEPFTFQLIDWFRRLDANAVQQAMDVLKTAAAQMIQFASGYDVLLCPTLTSEPKRLGFLSPTLDRETLIERTEQYVGYTPIHNISGLCAMSVPLFVSKSGLPIGSHFAAKPGAEAILLNLAYQLEAAAPWVERLHNIQ